MLKNLFTKQHHLIYPALTLGGIYFVVANILKILPVYVPTSIYMFCVGLLLVAALFVLFLTSGTLKRFIRKLTAIYKHWEPVFTLRLSPPLFRRYILIGVRNPTAPILFQAMHTLLIR